MTNGSEHIQENTDYKALVREARDAADEQDYNTVDTLRCLADAVEALVAERDEAVRQLGVVRQAFGDMEARVAELEAVIAAAIAECTDRDSAGDMLAVLESAPSELLAEHDKAVAAEAWDEGYMRGQYPWTRKNEEADPIPKGHGPARYGRNANPYRTETRS